MTKKVSNKTIKRKNNKIKKKTMKRNNKKRKKTMKRNNRMNTQNAGARGLAAVGKRFAPTVARSGRAVSNKVSKFVTNPKNQNRFREGIETVSDIQQEKQEQQQQQQEQQHHPPPPPPPPQQQPRVSWRASCNIM